MDHITIEVKIIYVDQIYEKNHITNQNTCGFLLTDHQVQHHI